MKKVVVSLLAGALLALSLPGRVSAHEKDIVETAVSAGSFQTLVAAVKAAGLVETLQGDGPFTVFAPTDEAFSNLPDGTVESLLRPENKDKLVSILTYHVVPGAVTASDVVKLRAADTVEGSTVQVAVNGSNVFINNARVVKTDIECSNGIIHVIDAVLLPGSPNSSDTSSSCPSTRH